MSLQKALLIGRRRVAKAHSQGQGYSRIIPWRGLIIGIENDTGSIRRGSGPDGSNWETTMLTPYGEIQDTEGLDEGDALDIFVREDGLNSCVNAYVIGIVSQDTEVLDEEKVMLGYASAEEALNDFAAHYDDASKYFGYISALPIDTFVRYCHEPARKGVSLVPNATARAKLGRKRIREAKAAQDDRADWMKAMVAKALGIRQVAKGLSVEQIDQKVAALTGDDSAEAQYQLSLLSYARIAQSVSRDVSKAISIAPDEDLYIRIWPGKNALDLQNEVIPVDLIYKSWSYYVECGNIDLEHISKMGGKTWREKAAKIEAAGFNPSWGSQMRIQYEIGRPVPGSLRIEEMDDESNVTDFSFVAKIHGGSNEAAQWFRSTLPYIPWKPSVGGQMSEPVKVIADINDPQRNIKRTQEISVARDFRWNNVGLSLETVNSHVRPIQILQSDEVAALLNVPQPKTTVSA